MHLFWIVACAAVVWAVRTWRPELLTRVGGLLVATAVVGIAVVVGRDLSRWLELMPTEYRHFWPRRTAYAVLTLTDVPLVQALVAGLAGVALGWTRTPTHPAPGQCPDNTTGG